MKPDLRHGILCAALAVACLGGCATAPEQAPSAVPAPARARPPAMDGGIVGTGNRPECEEPECRRDDAAKR